jgi:branched-chain amino acid transport system substrate-binding protein
MLRRLAARHLHFAGDLSPISLDTGSGIAGTALARQSMRTRHMAPIKFIGLALGATLALSSVARAQDITVAVAGPMTGGESPFGMQMKNGAELAVADLNAAGGVLGKKLSLQVSDDACDPKQARSVAEKIAGAKIPFVAGHFCSSSSIPASEAYADGNVLQITPASTNPLFTERKLWNVARVCGRDDQQGLVAADYIAKNFKDKNVAILNDKTTYGKGLADETKKALNKAGVTEKLFESYNKGDKDFNSIVSRLKRDNIDLVFVGGYHQEAGLILRQMRDQGMKTVLMAGDAMNDKAFASITGPAAEGTLFTFGPDPRNKPTAKAIVDKFKAKNIDPEGYTLYTYAAFQVWTQAVTKVGGTDPKKVMDAIKAGEWDTVLGKMAFDAKGDIKAIDYVVYKWDANGNYAEINPGKSM